jgi:hypothetical protein
VLSRLNLAPRTLRLFYWFAGEPSSCKLGLTGAEIERFEQASEARTNKRRPKQRMFFFTSKPHSSDVALNKSISYATKKGGFHKGNSGDLKAFSGLKR